MKGIEVIEIDAKDLLKKPSHGGSIVASPPPHNGAEACQTTLKAGAPMVLPRTRARRAP